MVDAPSPLALLAPRSSDARSLDRREVSRRSESEMHTLETLEYRAPLAALLPTVHASVPYFFDAY